MVLNKIIMCKKCFDCSETFSLVLVANKNTYAFPQGATSDCSHIQAIAIRRQNAAGNAKNLDKVLLAPDSVLAGAFLKVTLEGGREHVKNIPLDFLAFPAQTGEPFCVDWNPVRYNDTAVTLDPAAAGFVAGQAIEITVWYKCDC